MTTTDLSKFGYRERKMAEELLQEWNQGNLPEELYNYHNEHLQRQCFPHKQ